VNKNHQPVEKTVRNDDGFVDLHSIFYTIQGEGPFAGSPAVFVRLAGCNLQCPICDTEYTDGRRKVTPTEVLSMVYGKKAFACQLIVITGGEPFRQPIGPLIETFLDAGFAVQIESNGTLPPPRLTGYEYQTSIRPPSRGGAYIVCSPKAGKVNEELVSRACCFKYVMAIDDGIGEDGLPLKALGHTANPRLARPPSWWDRPVYLQPADEQDMDKNFANQGAVVKSCMERGYTLQLQIHKLIGRE
jgi:7-carboxy-7-deazaguanine synthase